MASRGQAEAAATTAIPQPERATPPPPSITETVTRFLVLYLTTLFSLDTVTAARQSPFSIPDPQIPDALRDRSRGDWGEGQGIGFRLDPGGRMNNRRGGFGGGGGGQDINVPVCKNCPMNGVPKIS